MHSTMTIPFRVAVAFFVCGLLSGCGTSTPPPESAATSTPAPATAVAVDAAAPRIVRPHPAAFVIPTGTTTPIGAEFSRSASASGSLSVTLELDGTDVSAQAQVEPTSVLYHPSEPLSEGLHEVRLRLSEPGGASVEERWSFVVGDRPAVLDYGPSEIEVAADAVVISARFADPSLAIDTSRIQLIVDGVDVSDRIELAMDTPRSGSLRYRPVPALAPGRHRVELELANEHSFAVYEPWGFWVAKPLQQDLLLLFPAPESTIDHARVMIGVRPYSSRSSVRDVRIQGLPTESSNYEDGYLHHYAEVDLEPGENRIEVVARYMDGTLAQKVFNLHRSP